MLIIEELNVYEMYSVQIFNETWDILFTMI